MFKQIFQQFLRQFFKEMGREPGTPAEWMQIQDQAVRYLNKTKGAPSIKKEPFQGWNPRVIEGGKSKGGIEELIENEDIFLGKAPKTKKSTLDAKKDRHILFRDAEEAILRKKRENKQAVEEFKRKFGKNEPKTAEDFRDKGDWDPYGMAEGGIAPLIGEPSYAADFYDDRVPMAGGGALKKFIEALFIKASNDIRLGKGKWKGFNQKQRIVQHDNLTKKVVEFQKSGNTEGLEIYFDVDPHKAFAAAENKVKTTKLTKSELGKITKEDIDKGFKEAKETEDFFTEGRGVYQKEADEILKQNQGLTDDEIMQKAYDEIKGGSGFTDDYKYDADILAEEYAKQKGKVYTDLPESEISKYYNQALKRVTKDLKAKMDFKKGLKDVEEKIELQMFDPKDRLPNYLGGRIGYSGGGKAGLPAITQETQTPQMNMQGPQMPAGPQPAGIPGGTIVAQNQMLQNPWMQNPMMGQRPMKPGIGGMPLRAQMPRRGLPLRAQMAGGGMGRRAFMKLMAGITALPFVGKGGSKVAPKAVKETAEVITRGADGMPTYITDLIEVVKAKGTRDIVEGFKKSDYSTVHRYKGVDVIEDPVGNIKIKSDRGGVATDPHTGKTHEGIAQEHHMQIEKGGYVKNKKGEMVKAGDEYVEGTVRPDMDGKMKDFEDGLDEDVHAFFKEIADEVDTIDQHMWSGVKSDAKKASGGLAYMLGE